MTDTIIYVAVSIGGGIDGRDSSDTGGTITAAFLSRKEAEKNPNAPWNTIRPEVYDLDEVARSTLARMTPVERLAVEQYMGRKGACRS